MTKTRFVYYTSSVGHTQKKVLLVLKLVLGKLVLLVLKLLGIPR